MWILFNLEAPHSQACSSHLDLVQPGADLGQPGADRVQAAAFACERRGSRTRVMTVRITHDVFKP
jgi:hypothetical protein